MIGTDDPSNEEESALKVTDKRKFNEDGSLREGVVLEKDEPKPEREPEANASDAAASGVIQDPGSLQAEEANETVDESPAQAEADEKDPASFINFLSTLVTNAAAALGAIPHPVTGQKATDLDTGKYWIDVLLMLRKKTKGNLSAREDSLLTSILSDLQMQYVALSRATEEKLKAQAAKKFSSKDILGG
ncbi:MAG: DUF1844 domain-containing protein [Acidobacteriota bacterium]|nr:DUF1844 domain-containing protein [Acidobacteriota bacterium]MDH3528124.1 DUF1844 domain-containing protein [Acidobacteriota bacterium]